MVDFKEVIKGGIMFFVGLLGTVVSWFFFDGMMEVLIGVGISTTLVVIAYVGCVLVWIIAMIIAPIYAILKGMGYVKT
jgi:hypothetical protein